MLYLYNIAYILYILYCVYIYISLSGVFVFHHFQPKGRPFVPVPLPTSQASWGLTFGECFNQSLSEVTLPSSLRHLTFGHRFDQCLGGDWGQGWTGSQLWGLDPRSEDWRCDSRRFLYPMFHSLVMPNILIFHQWCLEMPWWGSLEVILFMCF